MSLTPGAPECQHGRMRRINTAITVLLLFLVALPAPLRAEAALLSYEEVVTGGADPATPLPMLIAIHGLGGGPATFKTLFTSWTDVPVRVIVPRGPMAHGRGWSWFETKIRNGDVVKISEEDIRTSADRIAALIEQLVATRPTLGKPIVAGFSQGGVLSFVLAVTRPGLIAGAIPMGGWLPESFVDGAPPPEGAPSIRALHGKADTLVPFSRTRAVVQGLEKAGWDATHTGYPGMKHTLGTDMRSDLRYHVKEFVILARMKKGK